MMVQVNENYYKFSNYTDIERWSSYFYQAKEILAINPKSVLEIGGGSGVLKKILEKEGIAYKSMDTASDLAPDILGSVEKIPAGDNSFDMVCAFEVLEHLPFDKFENCLQEIKRVAKKDVIISLPHFGPPIKISFKIPFLPEVKISIKIPFYKKHIWNGQHYWEIGKKGISPRKIRRIIKKQFVISKEYVPFENQYHHFYIMKK